MVVVVGGGGVTFISEPEVALLNWVLEKCCVFIKRGTQTSHDLGLKELHSQ